MYDTPKKKRFTPTIPPKRDRITVKKSETLKDRKSAQPDTVPQRENCGRGYVINVINAIGWLADQTYSQTGDALIPPFPPRRDGS
jgi:hypothetical protein